MTKSTITRERIEWLNYAATGLAANGTEMAMSPQDVIALTECCLAAMDSEPVVFTDERNLHHIVMGRETSLIWGKQNQEAGDIALYRNAQPAPVLPDGLRLALSNAGIAAPESDEMLAATQEKYIQMLVTWVKDRKPFQPAPVVLVMPDFKKLARELVDNLVDCGGLDEGVKEKYLEWAEKACRAAMLQAGNSPVIPDGYVMVPKEPTEAMINAWLSEVANWRGHVAGYEAMLAAAPQEVRDE
ncbi:DUF551 domain-containing protein [Klebsiella oxytoca]